MHIDRSGAVVGRTDFRLTGSDPDGTYVYTLVPPGHTCTEERS
jgi:hypothetical protein